MKNYQHRPATMEEMHMQSEIVILGVIKKLREYARKPEHQDMQCELDIAANLIEYFIRNSDDFK